MSDPPTAEVNAWGMQGAGAGAWGEEVEAEEAHGTLEVPKPFAVGAMRKVVKEDDFPELGAMGKPESKGKKGKPVRNKNATTVPLAQFAAMGGGGGIVGGGAFRAKAAPVLPSKPRARDEDEEEDPETFGRGLRGIDYDRQREGARGGFQREDRNAGGFGGFEGGGDDRPASRADELNDWGSERQFRPTPMGGRSGGFGGGGGGGFPDDRDRPRREDMGPSQADTADSWGGAKKFVASEPGYGRGPRSGGYEESREGGFRERPEFAPSQADEVDSWGEKKLFQASTPSARVGFGGERGGADGGAADRAESDRWERRGPPPADSMRTQERPRGERKKLELKPRTDKAPATEAPVGAAFGGARPREAVLTERGVDPAAMDAPSRVEPAGGEAPAQERAWKSAPTAEVDDTPDPRGPRPPAADEEALAAVVAKLQAQVAADQGEADYMDDDVEGEDDGEGATITVADALKLKEAALKEATAAHDADWARSKPAPAGQTSQQPLEKSKSGKQAQHDADRKDRW